MHSRISYRKANLRDRETIIINDAKGVQENKMQVNPQSHVTKQSHKRDLNAWAWQGICVKK